MADVIWPAAYQSDFAVQVTSHAPTTAVHDQLHQQQPHGHGHVLPEHRTSKAHVRVTVGMMTTGYDCPDLLNLGRFAPSSRRRISFRSGSRHRDASPSNGRGHGRRTSKRQDELQALPHSLLNCEYFEEEFDADEVRSSHRVPRLVTVAKTAAVVAAHAQQRLRAPRRGHRLHAEGGHHRPRGHEGGPHVLPAFQQQLGERHRRRRRRRGRPLGARANYVQHHLLDKPTEHYTLDKLRSGRRGPSPFLREVLKLRLISALIEGRSAGTVRRIPRRCETGRGGGRGDPASGTSSKPAPPAAASAASFRRRSSAISPPIPSSPSPISKPCRRKFRVVPAYTSTTTCRRISSSPEP